MKTFKAFLLFLLLICWTFYADGMIRFAIAQQRYPSNAQNHQPAQKAANPVVVDETEQETSTTDPREELIKRYINSFLDWLDKNNKPFSKELLKYKEFLDLNEIFYKHRTLLTLIMDNKFSNDVVKKNLAALLDGKTKDEISELINFYTINALPPLACAARRTKKTKAGEELDLTIFMHLINKYFANPFLKFVYLSKDFKRIETSIPAFVSDAEARLNAKRVVQNLYLRF